MDEAIIDETELDLGPSTPKLEPGKSYVKVISKYNPQRDDELALNIGEIIEIITKFQDSWWEGRSLISGRVGMFPLTFTQPCDQDDKSKSKVDEPDSSEEEIESEDEESDEEEDASGTESEVSESVSEDEEEESEDEEEAEESENESEPEEEKLPEKIQSHIATPAKTSNSAPTTRVSTPQKATTKPASSARQRSASSLQQGNAGSTVPEKERSRSAGENKLNQRPVEVMPSPKRDSSEPGSKRKKKTKKAAEPSGFLATLEGSDIRRYRDTLAAKEIEIEKLRKEVKTLTVLQKRQDKAIKTLDTEKGEMPRLLHSMHDELRVLREKLRDYQTRHVGDEKLLQTQHEEILKLKKQMEDQQKLLKSKGVDATTVNHKVKHLFEEKEKLINDLTHKANILSKAKEMEEKKYRTQIKEYQNEIDKMTGEMDKLKSVLKEHGLNRVVRDVEKSPSPTRGRTKTKDSPGSSPSKKKVTKSPKDSKKKKKEIPEVPVLPKRSEAVLPPSEQPNTQQAQSSQVAPSQPSYNNQSSLPAADPEAAHYGWGTILNMGSSSSNLEPSPRDELSFRKKSPKNLMNPFSKLNEPSPPVTVPPTTMLAPTPAASSNPAAQRTTIFGAAKNANNPVFGSSSTLSTSNTGNSSFRWKGTTSSTTTTTNTATPEGVPPTTFPPTGTGNTGYVPSQPQESALPSRPLFLGGTQPPAENKPSWMFGPTTANTVQDQGSDVFKPNFGFNRKKDKDRWKVSS